MTNILSGIALTLIVGLITLSLIYSGEDNDDVH